MMRLDRLIYIYIWMGALMFGEPRGPHGRPVCTENAPILME